MQFTNTLMNERATKEPTFKICILSLYLSFHCSMTRTARNLLEMDRRTYFVHCSGCICLTLLYSQKSQNSAVLTFISARGLRLKYVLIIII